VFHPMDTSDLLIEIGYPSSFILQTDTLDFFFISIRYSLSFIIEMDSLNLSIGFYKNDRTCLRFNFLTGV
jgi:hypothetical protein